MSHFTELGRSHERTGIISRTLSPSPTIKWILPARIRSKSKNDVIFVGETCIQLREFLNNGQLADATGKLVLPAQILSAKVISAKLEAVPTLDAILDQDSEEERYMIKGRPIDDYQPPEILVLCTTANDVIYFYAKDLENGSVKFVFARRTLLGGLSIPEKYGKQMAVDPESRALAIAPLTGYCTVFALKPIDDIKSEIDRWRPSLPESFAPALEQRFIQVDGSILKMDFLRSTEHDPTKIILALLVANEGGTRLLLYRWDSRFPLHQIKSLRCTGQQLPLEDSFPLMLIPSARNSSFILVTETGLALYDHITSAQSKRIGFALPKEGNSKPQNMLSQPLWVQWAKPHRHRRYQNTHDDIVLVREDGLLLTYLISDESPMKIKANFSPGNLGINVDTAFCMLGGPPHMGGDILVAGGDFTDGGVFHIKALNVPERTQTFANIAPVQDMVLIDKASKLKSSNALQIDSTDQIFMCCGKKEGLGALVELNYGLEAQVGWTMAHPDSGSIDRFWSIELQKHGKMFLLASHPMHTSLVIVDLLSQEMEFADAESGYALDFETPTLVAGVMADDVVIQITRRKVNLFHLSNGKPSNSSIHDGFECVCACIFEEDNLFSTAVNTSDGIELKLAIVPTESNASSSFCYAPIPFRLANEPISMCFFKIAAATILLVGTENGTLYGFHVRSDEGLHPIYQRKISDWNASIKSSAICSLCVLSLRSSENGLLLCGLRDGSLLCTVLNVKLKNDQVDLRERFDTHHHLGTTSVTLSVERNASMDDEHAVLVHCLCELRRVRLIRNGFGVDFDMRSLWITNRDNSCCESPHVNAIHRVQQLSCRAGEELSGLVVCATADNVLFCSIVSQPQSVLRRIAVHGLPKRLVYSKYLKKIVIAAETTTGLTEDTSNGIKAKRPPKRPTLQLIDPDMKVLNPDDDLKTLIDAGEPGERIRSLINWSPTDGHSHFEMLVLAFEKDDSNSSKRTGRVVCISAKTILKGRIAEARPKVVGRYPGKPATSVCAVGRSSLAVAAGNEIILYNLDVGTRRWSTLSKYTLPSPALSLSSQGSFLFIATAYHSLLILEEKSNRLVFHTSDVKARTTSNVLNFNTSSTIVTAISDLGTNIMGFAENVIGNNVHPLFEANVPLILDRVREDKVSSSRKKGRHIFYGNTTDGTTFQFATLEEKEWKLLQFMESLCCPYQRPLNSSQSKARKSYNEDVKLQKAPIPRPVEMHVRGDLLNEMIEAGPYNLRDLLSGSQVKNEDEDIEKDIRQKEFEQFRLFKELAKPITGQVDDPIGAVTIWLRKLMNYPSLCSVQE